MSPDPAAEFETQRARLMGVGYRILGSVADAEDVLQEAWIRWSGADRSRIGNPEAFLTTVVTRLALDRLRRAKARRETYSGPWLPEPIAADADPEAAAELADTLSMALLVVLETLSPLERAAFVLREVFQVPYAEVAETLGREEAAVRQLVHRARRRVDEGRARFQADRATHTATVQAFVAACASADLEALLKVLSPDVVAIGDGGGVARAPRRPVHGPDKVSRLMLGITAKASPDLAYGFEVFNGRIGIVARRDGRAVAALSFTVTGGKLSTVHVIANPAKLAGLDQPVPVR
jgi:RNA polymerase sigma-70 factor (ECF subfamily)